MIRKQEKWARMSRLALLLLLCLPGFLLPVHAQDTSQAGQDATDQEEATGDGNSQAAVDDSEELILADTDEEEESPDRFIPTEEISQDLGVSFPVDI